MQTVENTLNPIHLRPTVMDVDLDAIEHNFNCIRDLVAPSKVMAIVKANAYGHGLETCGRFLESIGADFLGVAFVEEGIQLRQAGVKLPILVMGGIFGSQIRYFLEYDLDITASSVEKLQTIDDTAQSFRRRARVHLKIDTGMGRIGMHHTTAEKLLRYSLDCKHCDIIGAYTHLAAADSDPDFSNTQLERFLQTLSFYERNQLTPPLRHIARSSAALSYPNSRLDLVRTGLALYGVGPAPLAPTALELKPAMSLRSRVIYFKVVREGDSVSYGRTWTAKKNTRVITVPIGYGDGYFRSLSNKGSVLIRGTRYPIVGTICMDQLMVDIGAGEAYNGDEVVLIGTQGSERITVEEIAELAGTNTHEVLVATNLRVPRRYTRGGEQFNE